MFNIDGLMTTLPMILKGMIGIFAVIIIIMISIYLLNVLTNKKSK